MNSERLTNQILEESLAHLRKGGMVIVADDDDREAEGDFVMAASLVQDRDINLMTLEGRGLVCCAMDEASAERLALRVQSGALHDTPFTDSVDYLHGTTTGISCADRALGLRMLADPRSLPGDFARPGHLFPLVARPAGVLERRGHTEASVDLCRLAGLPPLAVICEIMNPDGTMARGVQLKGLAGRLGMPFLTVDQLARWRQDQEGDGTIRYEWTSQARLPTEWGEFEIRTALSSQAGKNQAGPVVLSLGKTAGADHDRLPPLVRVHSSCLTGDLFGSLRCDCGQQLREALRQIGVAGRGALIYLQQEGRGIGLEAKLKSYGLQDGGLDTLEANIALGYPADGRSYQEAAGVLKLMGWNEIRLLSNNPDKVRGLEENGIHIHERLGLRIGANQHNRDYLETKRLRCGHDL